MQKLAAARCNLSHPLLGPAAANATISAKSLRLVDFSFNAGLGGRWLQQVGTLPALVDLRLVGTGLEDTDLAAITPARFPALRELHVSSNAGVTRLPAGMASIPLTFLAASACGLGVASAGALKPLSGVMRSSLLELVVSDNPALGEAVAEVAGAR